VPEARRKTARRHAEDDVLDLLASLVEKSLVQTDVIEDTSVTGS
jgi:hypothetical protein